MKRFNITVNGNAYDVQVEEVGAGAAPAAPAAPVAVLAPAAALRRLPFRRPPGCCSGCCRRRNGKPERSDARQYSGHQGQGGRFGHQGSGAAHSGSDENGK